MFDDDFMTPPTSRQAPPVNVVAGGEILDDKPKKLFEALDDLLSSQNIGLDAGQVD